MGVILPFSSREATSVRLLARDKMDLHHWEASRAESRIDRIVLHDGASLDSDTDAEFVLAYETGACWATWGLARQGDAIVVWECAYGRDLGEFRTMDAALVILDHYAKRLPAARNRDHATPEAELQMQV